MPFEIGTGSIGVPSTHFDSPELERGKPWTTPERNILGENTPPGGYGWKITSIYFPLYITLLSTQPENSPALPITVKVFRNRSLEWAKELAVPLIKQGENLLLGEILFAEQLITPIELHHRDTLEYTITVAPGGQIDESGSSLTISLSP